MIKKETIDLIYSAARIEEVVGDFVSLKRRGSSLIGLCPFHNEKTPSFNVSPARGIYKCFGCGKGGNVVNFIMEHEQCSYPEALRWLANKYQITVEEKERTPEENIEQRYRESLLIVTEYARKFFIKQLTETDEGKSVGLSYFGERGFSDATIEKFQLGYSPENYTALTDAAQADGYNLEYLEKTGLTIVSGDRAFDRFRGRVIFPIHNISGKAIAFGARILKSDAKAAKYLNSPESDIYHKGKILYGIYFAKKDIVAKDECYLVEGYTDVISLHQAGIENVVASSGTALTPDQIRLIGRYTKNITVLYDGDPAGIKASLRGIDLILEEGLNVRVVLFPDGEDPDSFARKNNHYETTAFLKDHAVDFIRFKTSLLLKEVANDPIRKAGLIRDIVSTIGLVPDPIIRSTYVRECSVLMDISESVLHGELNKILRKKISRQTTSEAEADTITELMPEVIAPPQEVVDDLTREHQEADVIRILINYGDRDIEFEQQVNDRHSEYVSESVMSFIIHEILSDGISFEHPVYRKVFGFFEKLVHEELPYHSDELVNHEDTEISTLAADMLAPKYVLSNWERHGIEVRDEINKLKHAVISAVCALKIKCVNQLLAGNREKLKETGVDDLEFPVLLEEQKKLDSAKSKLSEYLSIVVLK